MVCVERCPFYTHVDAPLLVYKYFILDMRSFHLFLEVVEVVLT
jgi:hypothetical protein